MEAVLRGKGSTTKSRMAGQSKSSGMGRGEGEKDEARNSLAIPFVHFQFSRFASNFVIFWKFGVSDTFLCCECEEMFYHSSINLCTVVRSR